MSNPFEDNGSTFLVLINDEGQHSLWPYSIDIPAGWNSIFGPDERAVCLDYIEQHWVDMRPRSLVDSMA